MSETEVEQGEQEEPLEGDELAPDETDEPETDEPEQPTPEQPTPDDVEAMIARDKALDREFKRHEKALEGIHGEQWGAHSMCPLCEGDGYLTPLEPGTLPEQQLAAIDAFSGKYTPPEYIEDADYEQCAHCAGHGRTVTGAVNPEHLTKLCDKCAGNGFIRKLYAVQPVPVVPLTAPGTAPTPQAPVNYGAPGEPDAWGRPVGHVHYGIEPQYVQA